VGNCGKLFQPSRIADRAGGDRSTVKTSIEVEDSAWLAVKSQLHRKLDSSGPGGDQPSLAG
jgi:hypothetical protein